MSSYVMKSPKKKEPADLPVSHFVFVCIIHVKCIEGVEYELFSIYRNIIVWTILKPKLKFEMQV